MGVFTMPSLGSDMESGRLVEWLVAPGDKVGRGDVIAVVETQKGAIEIETFDEGTVTELTATMNKDLPVGAPLAVILSEGEQATEAVLAPAPKAPEPTKAVTPAAPVAAPLAPAAGPRPASPAARKRAAELGLDLGGLSGSGPGGAILLEDVERATPAAMPSRSAIDPAEEMRKAIAAAMSRAKRTIPHYYLSETIDVDPAMRFLEERNADKPPAERILLGALFVRAASLAAGQVVEMNGHYTDESGFAPSKEVNTGVAIALRGGGLVAPALMDAANLSLAETMSGMRDLVSRARAGRLRASEMTRGTITISSLGEAGAEAMTGVIFPPQVALVGLGAPHLRPWIVDGQIVPRHVVTLTLSADHRVSDGRRGARFITAFATFLKDPEAL